MNRNVAIALVVAILAAGGYWYFSGQQQAAMEQGEAAATAATEAASTAAAAVTEAASTAAAATTEAAPAAFDADAMTAQVDASTLDDVTKTTLKAAISAAKANPALVQGAMDQVKAALGM